MLERIILQKRVNGGILRNVRELSKGNVVAQDVIFNDEIILHSGEILTNDSFTKLDMRGISYIHVEDSKDRKIPFKREDIVKIVDATVDRFDSVLSGSVNYPTIQEISGLVDESVERLVTAGLITERDITDTTVRPLIAMVINSLYQETKSNLYLLKFLMKDTQRFDHSIETMIRSLKIGNAYGLPDINVVQIGIGALMHDVGMSIFPEEIAKNTQVLSQRNKVLVQMHTILGYRLLSHGNDDITFYSFVAGLHHETINGNGGYGMKTTFSDFIESPIELGEETLLPIRIIGIADKFSAIKAPKHYRSGRSLVDGFMELASDARKGIVDNKIVQEMLKLYMTGRRSFFSVGDIFHVSNEAISFVRPKPKSDREHVCKVRRTVDGHPFGVRCDVYEMPVEAISKAMRERGESPKSRLIANDISLDMWLDLLV